jgi:hypothetical protein
LAVIVTGVDDVESEGGVIVGEESVVEGGEELSLSVVEEVLSSFEGVELSRSGFEGLTGVEPGGFTGDELDRLSSSGFMATTVANAITAIIATATIARIFLESRFLLKLILFLNPLCFQFANKVFVV